MCNTEQQKEKIAEWMFQAIREYYMKKCTFPNDKHLEEVVESRCFVMTAKVYVDVLAVFSREGLEYDKIYAQAVALGQKVVENRKKGLKNDWVYWLTNE